ncbi:MAG: hypothetical protein ABIH99_05875 [Candidatus Micrarchaeota archaeon]
MAAIQKNGSMFGVSPERKTMPDTERGIKFKLLCDKHKIILTASARSRDEYSQLLVLMKEKFDAAEQGKFNYSYESIRKIGKFASQLDPAHADTEQAKADLTAIQKAVIVLLTEELHNHSQPLDTDILRVMRESAVSELNHLKAKDTLILPSLLNCLEREVALISAVDTADKFKLEKANYVFEKISSCLDSFTSEYAKKEYLSLLSKTNSSQIKISMLTHLGFSLRYKEATGEVAKHLFSTDPRVCIAALTCIGNLKPLPEEIASILLSPLLLNHQNIEIRFSTVHEIDIVFINSRYEYKNTPLEKVLKTLMHQAQNEQLVEEKIGTPQTTSAEIRLRIVKALCNVGDIDLRENCVIPWLTQFFLESATSAERMVILSFLKSNGKHSLLHNLLKELGEGWVAYKSIIQGESHRTQSA